MCLAFLLEVAVLSLFLYIAHNVFGPNLLALIRSRQDIRFHYLILHRMLPLDFVCTYPANIEVLKWLCYIAGVLSYFVDLCEALDLSAS